MVRNQNSQKVETVDDVDIASGYARRIVEREMMASHLERREAAAAVNRQLHLPGGTIWSVLYRKPKEIGTTKFRLIEQGFERLLETEIRRLTHELALFRAHREDNRTASLDEVETLLAQARDLLEEGMPIKSLSEAEALCNSGVLSA